MILEKGEKIIAEIRKHWFLYAVRLIPIVGIALLPLFGLVVFVGSGIQLSLEITGAHVALGLFAYFVLLTFLWVVAFVQWTDYYLDEWIVTPRRIIDIEQQGLFHREVSSLRFDRIQDITIEIPGFLATLLDYGEIRVQSAGDVREVILRGAKRPKEVKSILSRQLKEVREKPQRVTMTSEDSESSN